MSKYLVFGFIDYHDGAGGGWNDFHSAHETLADARNTGASLLADNKGSQYYEAQIVDACLAELVETLTH
jgi:hypothetical protein